MAGAVVTALVIAACAVGYVVVGFGVALRAYRAHGMHEDAGVIGVFWFMAVPLHCVVVAAGLVYRAFMRVNRHLDTRAERRKLPQAKAVER
jgi:heme/copper-type cytochrome/quinol oxidase subunit 3